MKLICITTIPQIDNETRYLLSLPENAADERRTLSETGLVDALSPDYIIQRDDQDGELTAYEFPGEKMSKEEWAAVRAAIQ